MDYGNLQIEIHSIIGNPTINVMKIIRIWLIMASDGSVRDDESQKISSIISLFLKAFLLFNTIKVLNNNNNDYY